MTTTRASVQPHVETRIVSAPLTGVVGHARCIEDTRNPDVVQQIKTTHCHQTDALATSPPAVIWYAVPVMPSGRAAIRMYPRPLNPLSEPMMYCAGD